MVLVGFFRQMWFVKVSDCIGGFQEEEFFILFFQLIFVLEGIFFFYFIVWIYIGYFFSFVIIKGGFMFFQRWKFIEGRIYILCIVQSLGWSKYLGIVCNFLVGRIQRGEVSDFRGLKEIGKSKFFFVVESFVGYFFWGVIFV